MKLDKIIAVRTGKTVYKDGGRVIKVFENGYSKADILNEALNQARIEETGLNIPKILGVTTEDGKWAIISEYISGKTLSQLMEESPDKFDEYLERFVDIQVEIHSKKSPLLTKLKDKMNRKIDMADIDAATRYDLHTRLEGMPRHDKVCHGDFNPSNVIITDSGKPYIIDWAHATRGNASADAARTYLLFRLEKKDDAAEKYIKLFCKKSGVSRQYIEKWLPIVAASQSVKGNSEEREMLLSWAGVVDYQ